MFKAIASAFTMKTPAKEAKHQLRETRLELLEARGALEHYQAKVNMLDARESRLAKHVAADEAEHERSARSSLLAHA